MTEPLIEERWVKVKPNVMEHRLDALRSYANYLSRRIDHLPIPPDRDKRLHAAIMWALAELSGIGDEVRRERAEREHATASMYRKAMKRAEDAEVLNARYRETIKALKAEVYRLGRQQPSSSMASAEYTEYAGGAPAGGDF